ncbi:MAG: chromosome segregation protein SMC [Alphaproteobacteria bacterium]|nr:MAG: chromosome segregation protein SMC [Alphaproteobacteria bacterium]
MHFTSLRLLGFKSFVEETELRIEPGLTGVVGPNGCGKSNLVEALRWVMGETSARRLRGAEMEDVIFAGTAMRPSRNLAEVSLNLDNTSRTAAAEFNNSDDLAVTRRIERGSGSDYKVNGRSVRARDVQILFADQATGAHASSMVSQGRIGALINAKPQDRRMVLEEAAGVGGLHARRHEAELRLKAAEANLLRVQDVLNTLDTQEKQLRNQARQAARYRSLSERLQAAEYALWARRWHDARAAQATAETTFAEAESQVRAHVGDAASATTVATERAADLPPLRDAAAAASALVQRLVLERQALDDEERRLQAETNALAQRQTQAATDAAREAALQEEAGHALARLTQEQETLGQNQANATKQLPQAQQARASAEAQVSAQEENVSGVGRRISEAQARAASLSEAKAQAQRRCRDITARLDEQAAQRAALETEIARHPDLSAEEARTRAAEQRVGEARATCEAAEASREETAHAEQQARHETQEVQGRLTRLRAEIGALEDMLRHGEKAGTPLSDLLSVEAGCEAALAAALGDALGAPVDENAPAHWCALPPYERSEALPEGVVGLDKHVTGSAALSRALSHIGLAPDAQTARLLAAQLRPGQALVTRAGDCWRWDGYAVTAQAPTPAAIRLSQRNRLTSLRGEAAQTEQTHAAATAALARAVESRDQAAQADRAARAALQQAFGELDTARRVQAELSQRLAAASSRLQALAESAQTLESDMSVAVAALARAEQDLAGLPDLTAMRAEESAIRAVLAEARAHLTQHQAESMRLEREAQSARARLETVAQEIQQWQARAGHAGQRCGELRARAQELAQQMSELAARPDDLRTRRTALMDKAQEAETAQREASDRLQAAENLAQSAAREARGHESALAEAREARGRAEAACQASGERVLEVAHHITAHLNQEPSALPEPDLESGIAALEDRLARLLRERDTMGPVNLCAEEEAAKAKAEIERLTAERLDLTEAMSRLRGGIGNLNREARERLRAAFDLVDGHFQDLFTRLFGGGAAHLKLVDSDDPLEAGLEIYASPPGKKLQILSLLSGGEQALTALALLFAVFLTNPSPICVLDEVDAPLDEANVGRFCDMLEHISGLGQTRFLVITHHRLTMARMHRLYGVTMAERGVSQLVSVNLAMAETLREDAPEDIAQTQEAA